MVGIADLLKTGGGTPFNPNAGATPSVQAAPDLAQARRLEMMAKLLQSQQGQTMNPLAAALSGFFGTRTALDAADQLGQIEAAKEQRQVRREDRQDALEERKVDISEQELEENKRQFNASLALSRQKFNAKKTRDAEGRAITRVKSPDGEVDLLFKGVEPLNDGLDKGLQWGIDKDGNRIAVPIPKGEDKEGKITKERIINTVDRLLDNEYGVGVNFGPLDRFTPNVSDSAMNAATDLNELRSLLTLGNLDKMKGVLSDADIKILRDAAAGGIAETSTTANAIRALKEIKRGVGGVVDDEPVKDTRRFNRATGRLE